MFERLPPSKRFFGGIFIFLVCIFSIFVFISSGISSLTSKKYVVYFDRSISGLKVGNQVFFKGVPVGYVDSIEIELPSTQRVKIILKIDKKMILYKGCTAKIGMQGLTGYSVLELNNTTSSERLSGHIPQIQSEYSVIEKLFDSIPEMVANANELIKELNRILVKNGKNIDLSIDRIVKVLDSMNSAFSNISVSAQTFNRCGERVEKSILPSAQTAICDFSESMKIWKDFSQGSMLQLMDLINNVNNISTTLNESMSARKGYVSYILGL